MCGICGVVYFDPQHSPEPARVRAMCAAIAHRGPDGEGVDIIGQAGLGHRRLSILDLALGSQPMFNEDGSVAVIFNGEIYNFRELRAQLEAKGHRFATDHSDTEPIVHLYEERGAECIEGLDGMFALALWDSRNRRLVLARDRTGKKPLYYAIADGAIWFASEMKALLACPEIPRRVSPRAIYDYLTHQYVPAPETIFQDIQKLPPGHRLVWEGGEPRVERYWTLKYSPKLKISAEEARQRGEALIDEAVRKRLESDVPLGCFLSGGIDSSLVVAMMRRHISGPLRTFSIGFEEEGFNELPYARAVANRFETVHEEFIVRADAARALPKIAWHFDEPFADMSAIPTLFLAEMTRRHVTVALNGDGGDESFAGYERYREIPLFEKWGRLPAWFRGGVFGPIARAADSAMPDVALFANARYVNELTLHSAAMRYAVRLQIFRDDQKRRMLTPEFMRQLRAQGGDESSLQLVVRAYESTDSADPVDRKMRSDIASYLPGDLLPKVDRTTMAYGLEARSPLLDRDLMEFAASLPGAIKFENGELKSLLKKIARPLIPAEAIDRPKRGFSTPVGIWFQRDLKDLTRELILSDRALARGLFNRTFLERMLRDHENGRVNHHHRLWLLMCLEMWFRTFADRPDPAAGPIEA